MPAPIPLQRPGPLRAGRGRKRLQSMRGPGQWCRKCHAHTSEPVCAHAWFRKLPSETDVRARGRAATVIQEAVEAVLTSHLRVTLSAAGASGELGFACHLHLSYLPVTRPQGPHGQLRVEARQLRGFSGRPGASVMRPESPRPMLACGRSPPPPEKQTQAGLLPHDPTTLDGYSGLWCLFYFWHLPPASP